MCMFTGVCIACVYEEKNVTFMHEMSCYAILLMTPCTTMLLLPTQDMWSYTNKVLMWLQGQTPDGKWE